MKFSIIIPVRSINNFMKESIDHLKELDYADFEVLIVSDSTETFDFKNDTRFRIISSGPMGPGEKRNLGAKQATGDILVFLDDDAYPKSDWLTKAAEAFNSTDTYALGAPAVTPLNATFKERCSGRVLESFLTSAGTRYRHIPMKRKFVNDYPTVNLFVKKEAFDRVGGFIKEFWPGEDTKLCLDLLKYYKRPFLYDPAPIVYHHRRELFLPHLKQISRYGMHRGQFARIFPETSRNLSYFIPSLFVIGFVFGWLSIFINQYLFYIYCAVVLIYIVAIHAEGFRIAITDKDLKEAAPVHMGIALTHFVYGINFIIGIIKRPTLKLRSFDEKTGNYLGG
ncbi:MAG TPA: glycosyltransferase [Candidatus Saccharimonadales bacterium]|nr:glycosyltransferase [Candidatus Saccharimonadales bacterium]